MGKDKGEKTPKDKSAKKEKKDKSAKKEKAAAEEQPEVVAVATKTALAPIAKPLADDKLSKKVSRAGAGLASLPGVFGRHGALS